VKVVYVAGPFSALTPEGVEAHIQAAEEWGRQIADLGAVPLVPHSIGRHMQQIQNYAWWTDATLELMDRADAVFFLPGWTESPGSRGEHAVATRNDQPVFYDLESLKDWLDAADVPTGVV